MEELVITKDLEFRLKDGKPEYASSLIAKLNSREYERAASRDNPYYKYTLIPTIISMINQYAPTPKEFAATVESTLNKDEAKRVLYGLLCTEPSEELKFVVSKLTEWERVYYFRGFWERSMQVLNEKSLTGIVQTCIKTGIDAIHKNHEIKRAKGVYKRELKLPESQNYRKKNLTIKKISEELKQGALEERFAQLLKEEDGTYMTEERTAIFLDSCTQDERKYLTGKFGAEKLGGYAA